jgi:Na+-driven multidrug efflux pump
LPQLGVTSAAVATIASFSVALAFLAWHMRRHQHPLAPDRELLAALGIDPALLRLVVKLGLPTGVQMVNYVQFPALSIAITASTLGAQAIGADNPGKLRAITRTGLKMNLVITGTLVLLGYLFSGHPIALFITSAPVIALAQTLLHIMLWSRLVFGFASVLGGVMRASGTVPVPAAISVFCIVAIEVPSAWVLSSAVGLNGVGWRTPSRSSPCWRCRRRTTSWSGAARRSRGWSERARACRVQALRSSQG